MALIEQPLAGATQYDGTTGKGLVTLADVAGGSPPQGELCIVVKSISYDSVGDAHDALLLFCHKDDIAVSGGRRQILLATVGYGGTLPLLNDFAKPCGQDGIVVPRKAGAAAGDSYVIAFLTTGKTGAATLVVHAYAEPVNK